MLEGTIGTTLLSRLRLATDTVSLETWGWGEESCVGFNISSCLWKKQMLQTNANPVAQVGEGGGCEFPEQTALGQTSGWPPSPETIWKSKWSTSLVH